jgi:2-amino-4-hydroxy-6-hydroxymethyldihydropteridine diphosphokinase
MGIFIALGANLPGPAGPPRAALEEALARLAAEGVRVLGRSRWYRSPAWPDPAEPAYVNAVAEIATALPAHDLLQLLHRIEEQLGRRRGAPNAPRTVDLDLLDYHGAVEGGSRGPILPHPRLHQRAFVLLPLAEIAPDWRHPVSRRAVAELIAALPAESRAEPMA